jgi:alkyl sulfatase BDS1-like metallo-beta-lactamase superfamily hydrolase
MSTELFLEFIGIRMDSKKAEDIAFKINLVTPDNDEKFIAELSNATFTVIQGYQAKDADLTITINRTDLESVMMGVKSLQAQIDDGTAKIEGNRQVLKQLADTLTEFHVAFEIIPGTVTKTVAEEELNDFEVGPIVTAHE